MVVQWLGLCTPTARGKGLIPGWGTKILQATHGTGEKKRLGRGAAGRKYQWIVCRKVLLPDLWLESNMCMYTHMYIE